MTVNMKIGVFWDVRLYSWYRGTNILEEMLPQFSGWASKLHRYVQT